MQLVQKAFALKEVQVKGLPVFGRQDTTVFDLKRYVSDRDNSLKDVLKKLPGIDVDETVKSVSTERTCRGLPSRT